jgi:hexosaminidase
MIHYRTLSGILLICTIIACSLNFLSCKRSTSATHTSNTVSIIPEPASIEYTEGSFALSQQDIMEIVEFENDTTYGKEGYELIVNTAGISIKGSPAGQFYGLQTLLQFFPAGNVAKTDIEIPCCKILDKPRFSWRGMHLDVARHFFGPELIKKCIDLMAMYKLNVFHWHLTDDQGWRIEIDAYPLLTKVGAWREGTGKEPWSYYINPAVEGKPAYGGFYTKEEIREIIKYAAERQITIVPEIELPGHSWAALLAYPELSCSGVPWVKSDDVPFEFSDPFCAGNELTFEFFENVLGEVIELFPSEYIHIGGDECKKIPWEHCEKCQKRMTVENLSSVEELQSFFIKRIEKIVTAKGRKIIGWDEILEGGLAPEASVMSWRGETGGIAAAKEGHKVVMTPGSNLYFNRNQFDLGKAGSGTVLGLKSVYDFEPVPAQLTEKESKMILGSQACLWSENMYTEEILIYQLMPRMTALAEFVWTPGEKKNWPSYLSRLENHLERFDMMGIGYAISPPEGLMDDIFTEDTYTVILDKLYESSIIRYTVDGTEPDMHSEIYTNPINVSDNTVLQAKTFMPSGRSSITTTGIYKKVGLSPPLEVKNLTPGLELLVLTGEIASLDNFETLEFSKNSTAKEISIPEGLSGDFFGLSFEGYIDIPEDGIYTFYTSSDDGSRLYIDGKLLVDNDGVHGMGYKNGKTGLKKGPHSVKLLFFENRYGEGLIIEIEGPKMERQTIPESMFFSTKNN